MDQMRIHSGEIRVTVEAPQSYQIKRILKALDNVKGLRMMKTSGVKPNRKHVPKLWSDAVFRDEKYFKR